MSPAPDIRPGDHRHLGARPLPGGVNFTLYAPAADRVELCLYGPDGATETGRVDLPERTDAVWHGFLPGLEAGQRYGYRVHGAYAPDQGLRFNANKLLLDPYARRWDRGLLWADPADGHQVGEIDREPVFDARDNGAAMVKALVTGGDGFDWRDDRPPGTGLAGSIIYELHVKGFSTLNQAIAPDRRGTYLGLVEPASLQHLQRLGITAVELLPVMGFVDEPIARARGLTNYWGYNTLGFFVPDRRYAVADPVAEFKTMVRGLHEAGIEVILDIVLNHTAEGDHAGPTLSFRGIDNRAYYRLDPARADRYDNPTGTGNALDFSNPMVVRLAMDCLRWWVTEYHVDGFRFDLATVLARRHDGPFDPAAGFLVAAAQDPVLRDVKLIAEPWDCAPGGWQVGNFGPGWSEWNDRCRDDLRRFFLRRDVGPGAVADRLAGSSTLFRHDTRPPQASLNFVTAHDGFTLDDLVTFEGKRNEANGEGNRDGTDNSLGWNAGVEGPTADPAIITLRAALKRVLLGALLAAAGVPMLSMGDEMGHSQGGNNNVWCQDNVTSWLDWTKVDHDLIGFVARLVRLRKAAPALTAIRWLDEATVVWLDPDGGAMTRWSDPGARGLGVLHRRNDPREALLLLINGGGSPVSFSLPTGSWRVLLDSAGQAPPTILSAAAVTLAGPSLMFLAPEV